MMKSSTSKLVESSAFPAKSKDKNKNQEEIDRLRLTNPLYDLFNPRWAFYLSAYEGGEDFANTNNIFRHMRENEADFEDRVKRIHNLNYVESLVEFFTNFIFSEPIDRGGGKNSEFFSEFIKDVNLKGDSIDDFMRTVSDDKQIFGMVYILVDAPQKPIDTIVTRQDEIEQNIRPYWVLIKPEEIINWVWDKFGNLTYAKRCQYVDEVLPNGVTIRLERYTEFFVTHTTVTNIDVTKPDEPILMAPETFENELQEIPLEIVRYKKSKKHHNMGLSFIRDFAYNNREIMNLTSLLQEFLYRQAFNILARQTDGAVPMQEQQEGVIGTANVIDVPKGAKMPEYITPPSDPAKFIQDERSRITAEMFKRASQDAVNELFNGGGSSGFSKAQSFSKTVPHIASRAETLERAEERLMRLTMKMAGKEWDGKIKYKDRYEITNLTDALTQLQIILRDFMLPSPTFAKEELKRIVREYDGKLPGETLAMIEKDIDEMDFDDWMDIQKQALVGRGVSPSEQQQPKSTGTMAEIEKESTNMPAATNKLREDPR